MESGQSYAVLSPPARASHQLGRAEPARERTIGQGGDEPARPQVMCLQCQSVESTRRGAIFENLAYVEELLFKAGS